MANSLQPVQRRGDSTISQSSIFSISGDWQDDISGILPLAKSSLALKAWSKWALPGHGRSYDDCGTFGYKGCLHVELHAGERPDGVSYEGKIYVKKFKRNCGRGECPVCFESWAAKEAHRAERRLRAFKPDLFRKLIHVIVSPSQEDVDRLNYQELREKAYFVLKRVGVFGGVVIIHPFRQNHQDKSWYLSPHFHVLGYGWVSNVGDTYEETGWVVKNLGIRQSVYATLQYQLSHAGIYMKAEGEKGKKATITWYGALSYNKFKAPDEELGDLCPICESPLAILRYVGVGDPPLNTLDNISETEWFVDYLPGKIEWEEVKYYDSEL